MNPREGTPEMEKHPNGSEHNVHNPRACDLHLIVDCARCMPAEIPAEIADARDLADTAKSNVDAAEAALADALEEFKAAQDNLTAARDQYNQAANREAAAGSAYVATLRRHGYVQTADGPRPAHTVHS